MDLKRSMEKCLRIELYKIVKMVISPPSGEGLLPYCVHSSTWYDGSQPFLTVTDDELTTGQLLVKQCQYAVAMLVGIVRHCCSGNNAMFKRDVVLRATVSRSVSGV